MKSYLHGTTVTSTFDDFTNDGQPFTPGQDAAESWARRRGRDGGVVATVPQFDGDTVTVAFDPPAPGEWDVVIALTTPHRFTAMDSYEVLELPGRPE